MDIYVFRACIAYALFAAAFGEIPSYIKICHRNDPKITDCITNSIYEIQDKLAYGIPELNVPSIEPFKIKHIRLLRGPVSARIDANLTDIQVQGTSKFKIHNLKFDMEKLIFTYHIIVDRLDFWGKYKINARILLLRLVGSGNIVGTFKDYKGAVIMQAQKIVKNNTTYMQFNKMKFNIDIGNAHINFDNLFNGDPILGTVTNDIINENSGIFLDEIKPALEASLEEIFLDVANKITGRFTYDELFPLD